MNARLQLERLPVVAVRAAHPLQLLQRPVVFLQGGETLRQEQPQSHRLPARLGQFLEQQPGLLPSLRRAPLAERQAAVQKLRSSPKPLAFSASFRRSKLSRPLRRFVAARRSPVRLFAAAALQLLGRPRREFRAGAVELVQQPAGSLRYRPSA